MADEMEKLPDAGPAQGGAPESGGAVEDLTCSRLPARRRFRPGEPVDYAGLQVELDGRDVTGELVFDLPEGTPWERGARRRAVRATYTDGSGAVHAAEFELRRRPPAAALLAAALALVAGAALAAAAWLALSQPEEASHVGADTGSRLIAQGDMTDEEVQALLAEQAEASRITVSVAAEMELSPDGRLLVNFLVPEPNNGLSERLVVEQGGRVVYESGVVQPGYGIESGQSSGAAPGPALATVRAVGADGKDFGNPVAVDVEIVAAA